MLANGLGQYVLHTFALSFLIAAIALWLVGVETKGRALEEINQAPARVTSLHGSNALADKAV